MKNSYFLALSLTALVVIAGCNQAPSTNSSNNNSTPPAATPTPSPASAFITGKDLCKLLSADEMSKLLGYPVTTNNESVPKAPHIAACNYKSDDSEKGNGVTIIANYDTAGMKASTAYADAVAYQKEYQDAANFKFIDVPNLGEKATIVSGSFISNILALQGDVWLTAASTDKGTEAREEKLKKIAEAAFNKL